MKTIYLFTLFLLLSLFPACDFGDINVDPTRDSDAGLNEILPVALTQSARNILSIGGRVTGTVVQHFSGTDAQPQSYTTYFIDEQTLTTFWETGLYAGAMKDCAIIIEKAQAQDQPIYEGIAKTLMAFNLALATTYWGDVPYSEALKGTASLKSSYDNQEAIYQSIQRLLDEAIVLFENAPSVGGPEGDDLIYGGDANRWKASAYALKARYLMHLTKRDDKVAEAALSAIENAFSASSEQPDFFFGNTDNESNPLALFGKERAMQMVVGDFLVNLMNQKSDPRRSKYWLFEDGKYLYFKLSDITLVRTQKSSPIPLISYTELLFLKAEAQLRAGQDTKASQTYTMALINSMEQVGVTAQQYNPYLAFNAGFSGLTTFEEKLERIITQKYIALYGQNPNEAWVDYRRTGFPQLGIPSNATSSFNPSLVIPRRYLYPISERTTNNEHYEAAITKQGGHLMDVAMWAFE
ncbi:MAG: hypothetical protein DHS20C18_06170 [Saprospiraceae bacterium]|nr:MAG: hypothetical protein DHS20C18_06170 [Saprospiraceae bacterium]